MEKNADLTENLGIVYWCNGVLILSDRTIYMEIICLQGIHNYVNIYSW